MAEIIGVRFKEGGKVYYFDPCSTLVEKGQKVIVETAQGLEYGECITPNTEINDEELSHALKKMVRIATPEDEKKVCDNQKKQEEAFHICVQKIAQHKLDMKLLEVEYAFDNSKILFYFTSDGRVDFRDLVKDLASVFRTRIELRQIGVRDEAKMLGGLGICGKEFCCTQFLGDFQPVSIKMAKEQNLSLNPVKISGTCGRLMCCLKYEQDAYEYLHKITPRVGASVHTPKGVGVVADANLLTGSLKVRFEKGQEVVTEVFSREEVKALPKEPREHQPKKDKEPKTQENDHGEQSY